MKSPLYIVPTKSRILVRIHTHSEYTTENGAVAVCEIFVVCSKSGTRQRDSLPCAAKEAHCRNEAHDKRLFCRVPGPRHTANMDTLTPFEPAVRVCRVPV